MVAPPLLDQKNWRSCALPHSPCPTLAALLLPQSVRVCPIGAPLRRTPPARAGLAESKKQQQANKFLLQRGTGILLWLLLVLAFADSVSSRLKLKLGSVLSFAGVGGIAVGLATKVRDRVPSRTAGLCRFASGARAAVALPRGTRRSR